MKDEPLSTPVKPDAALPSTPATPIISSAPDIPAKKADANPVHTGFDEWCKTEGLHEMNAADFIRGAAQAYRTVGAILGSKLPHSAISGRPRFEQLARALMYDSSSPLAKNGPLPFTRSFCEVMDSSIANHGKSVNVFSFSAPKDLVVSASLSKFVVSDYVGQISEEVGTEGGEKAGIGPTQRVTVTALMYVVVPPQRFHSSYDFFHQRMSGTECENERVAVARLFAASGVGWFARLFDGVVRAMSGTNAEFLYTKSLGSMLGIPETIDQCPPCIKKNLTFLLSSDRKKWLLASIENLEDAQGKPFPDPSGSAPL